MGVSGSILSGQMSYGVLLLLFVPVPWHGMGACDRHLCMHRWVHRSWWQCCWVVMDYVWLGAVAVHVCHTAHEGGGGRWL